MQKSNLIAPLIGLILAAGCESGSISDKSSPSKPSGDRSPSADPQSCVSIKSLDVLEDGKTVLSYITNSNKVLWDIEAKGLVAKTLPVNFVQASYSGEKVIGKISGGKYQVSELEDKSYRPIMIIGAIGKVHFQFSSDAKVLSVHHSLPSGLDQVDIYDLEERRLLNSYSAYSIRYVRLSENGEDLVVGYDYGWSKAIGKYKVTSLEEEFVIQLPSYLRFSYMELSKNAIIAKVRSAYRTYSLANGDFLGSFRYGSVYTVDSKRDLVLTSFNWGEFEVKNTLSGELIFSGAYPDDALLSSCVFSSGSSITCLKKGSNQVMSFDFKQGASVTSCF